MRELIDLYEDLDDEMRNDKTRRAKLKAEIKAGYMPVVYNVSSTIDPVYTMGDVEALGWMTKDYHTERMGHDDYDTTWTRYYHSDAPAPIKVSSGSRLDIWQPGHREEN